MPSLKHIEKPWGFEELLEHNDKYVVKRLTMKEGERCSLQFHEKKRETVVVVSGLLAVEHGLTADSLHRSTYRAGEFITIAPGQVHRMEALIDSVYLEASTPELNDVVRLADDYARIGI